MRKGVAFLCVCTMLLGLCGCMPNVRLNDRGIVEGLGIDRAEGGGYRLTLQVAEASAGQAQGQKIVLIEREGTTLVETLRDASVAHGKQLFLGSCQLVLLGEGLAREGVEPALAFLNANHQVNPSIPVAVARGDAGEVLKAQERSPELEAGVLADMVASAMRAGQGPRSELREIVGAIHGEHLSGMLTMIGLREDGASGPPAQRNTDGDAVEAAAREEGSSPETQKQQGSAGQGGGIAAEVAGTAVFYRDRMETALDPEASLGLGWLLGLTRSATLSVEDDGLGYVSAVSHGQESSIRPGLTGDLMVFDIAVKIRCTVLEASPASGHLEESGLERVQALQERMVRGRIERMLDATQRQGYDVLGLSLLVKQRHPGYYRQAAGDWERVMREAGYRVTVDCKIDRSGAGNHVV